MYTLYVLGNTWQVDDGNDYTILNRDRAATSNFDVLISECYCVTLASIHIFEDLEDICSAHFNFHDCSSYASQKASSRVVFSPVDFEDDFHNRHGLKSVTSSRNQQTSYFDDSCFTTLIDDIDFKIVSLHSILIELISAFYFPCIMQSRSRLSEQYSRSERALHQNASACSTPLPTDAFEDCSFLSCSAWELSPGQQTRPSSQLALDSASVLLSGRHFLHRLQLPPPSPVHGPPSHPPPGAHPRSTQLAPSSVRRGQPGLDIASSRIAPAAGGGRPPSNSPAPPHAPAILAPFPAVVIAAAAAAGGGLGQGCEGVTERGPGSGAAAASLGGRGVAPPGRPRTGPGLWCGAVLFPLPPYARSASPLLARLRASVFICVPFVNARAYMCVRARLHLRASPRARAS